MFLEDVIAYELLRLNLGFKNYTDIERMCRFMRFPPLYGITHDPNFFPSAKDLSYILTKIPSDVFFQFFQLLVNECIEYGIIIPRILIWDGQFIRSNCKNNKDKGKPTYNDPDAGYCRHNGTKKGVGYDPGILYAYCFNRWFPVYFKMFPGNRNDIPAFRETVKEFLANTKYNWSIIIADSGAYSKKNLDYIRSCGMIPIIRARKNLKTHPVKELKKGFFFNTDYIPKNWSDDLYLKVYSFRPMIEQGNSSNITFYNNSRLNTRGYDAAVRSRCLIYILVLLKALTAYKLGRPDLIMKPTAFEASRYLNFRLFLPFLARKSGYTYFNDLEVLRRLIKENYTQGFL
ncbi:MAG: transposase [Promethearchaeota archaeon]